MLVWTTDALVPARLAALALGIVASLLVTREGAASCSESDFSTCTTMSFTATAASVADPLGLFGAVDPVFTGWVTIETDIDDTIGGPDFGFYPGAVECAEVDLGQTLFGVSVDLATPGETPGIRIENDLPSSAGGFTLLADGLEGSIVGLTALGGLGGGGGIAYGYGQGCIQGFPGCPPSLLTDDSIPGPPGDLTSGGRSGEIVVRFLGLTGGAAILSGNVLEITSSPDRPCPEPALAASLGAPLLCLAGFARHAKRVRSDHACRRPASKSRRSRSMTSGDEARRA